MIRYLDSSVPVASLLPYDPDYTACERLITQPGGATLTHALNETFATLTGGRLGIRTEQDAAAAMIGESLVPFLHLVELAAASGIRMRGTGGRGRRLRWRGW